MLKTIIQCALLLLFVVNINAQNNIYAVSKIEPSLLKNASAVIRNDKTTLKVESKNKLTQQVKFAITILNKNKSELANFKQYYNTTITLKNLSAIVYDAQGNQIKKIKTKKFDDYSATDSRTIADDNRVKYFQFSSSIYPVTIEYQYELHYDGFINLPSWSAFNGYNVSTENSEYTVEYPDDFDLKILELNLKNSAEEKKVGNNIILNWQERNLPAIKNEAYSDSYKNYMPTVLLSPQKFKYEGYEGSFASWNNFGSWISKLNEGRDVLDKNTIQKIKELTENAKSDLEKIEILYTYLQNKTRYVSIQLGIGGFQPFPAKKVEENSYGDCKALSNYMKSILNAAGINSNYILIKAGENNTDFINNFPSSQFNHAILAVPNNGDTIWLECTSQKQAFGYLGTFTSDRPALLVTENGGKLVNTPNYDHLHIYNRNATFFLNEFELAAKIELKASGLFYDKTNHFLLSNNYSNEEKLSKLINNANFELSDFNYNKMLDKHPSVKVSSTFLLKNKVQKIGDKLLISLNPFYTFDENLKTGDERISPIVFRRPYNITDTIKFKIPSNYKVLEMPKDEMINSPFGRYELRFSIKNDHLICLRKNIRHKGVYPKENYSDLHQYLNKIEMNDNIQVVLDKKL